MARKKKDVDDKAPEAAAPKKISRQQRRRAELIAEKMMTPTPAEVGRMEMRRRQARRQAYREAAHNEGQADE